jgi:hypothetical protein
MECFKLPQKGEQTPIWSITNKKGMDWQYGLSLSKHMPMVDKKP